jgi:chromate transporter
LLGAGALAIAIQKQKDGHIKQHVIFPLLISSGVNPDWAVKQISHLKIFFTFLKIGAILYGSGYVLFAYVDSFLVAEGYLTRQQLLDAIAIGQFTPGPVLSTATFIGYQLGGFVGAMAATLGIFLPSFFFVFLLNKALTKWQKSTVARVFLDAVNAASVAIMFWVLIELTGETLVNGPSFVIVAISGVLTFTVKKWSAVYTIILGAVLGYLTLYVFPLL